VTGDTLGYHDVFNIAGQVAPTATTQALVLEAHYEFFTRAP